MSIDVRRTWGEALAVSALLAVLMTGTACGEIPQSDKAEVTDGTGAIGTVVDPMETTQWLPLDFEAPILVQGAGFQLVPLGPDLVDIDYDAYMSSIKHLQTTFTRSENWPTAGLTAADAMLDMKTEEGRFKRRESFAYGVLTPDGQRERGSVYVKPSSKMGYDAQVQLWVTQAEFDNGFDGQLYEFVSGWVAQEWPFHKVAYPGRAIDWKVWDDTTTIADLSQADKRLFSDNLATSERMIDAFYSFDPARLDALLTKAGESTASLLYYQGWAEGGNYKVLQRSGCFAETPNKFHCPITVQDDPVLALNTGFNVTDTFAITFEAGDIVDVDTSSNDQPIYYEARKWVEKNLPDVMSGPCKERTGPDVTPGDCARAMTAGYKQFYAARQAGKE